MRAEIQLSLQQTRTDYNDENFNVSAIMNFNGNAGYNGYRILWFLTSVNLSFEFTGVEIIALNFFNAPKSINEGDVHNNCNDPFLSSNKSFLFK